MGLSGEKVDHRVYRDQDGNEVYREEDGNDYETTINVNNIEIKDSSLPKGYSQWVADNKAYDFRGLDMENGQVGPSMSYLEQSLYGFFTGDIRTFELNGESRIVGGDGYLTGRQRDEVVVIDPFVFTARSGPRTTTVLLDSHAIQHLRFRKNSSSQKNLVTNMDKLCINIKTNTTHEI